jgi:uncharacterized protein (TIGR02246 family)
MPTARDVVAEHLAAFNAHDSERLLAGFADDASWSTGQDVVRGRHALAEMFDAGLWELDPTLTVISIVAGDQVVAAELHERITIDGDAREFSIAAFFEVFDDLIHRAKVYREGTADID